MKSEGAKLLEQVASLAEKIQSGEVAFFVGAGFSLDSEQNSTTRLQLRLLRRFDAMSHIFGHSALRETFALTFGLTKILRRPMDSCLHPQVLDRLKNDYYPLNDWMCAAFARMLEDLYRDRAQSESKLEDVYKLERLLNDYVELWGTRRQTLLQTAGPHPLKMRGKPRPKVWIQPDPVPLSPIQLDELESILDPQARGKALFLETLGFSLNEIMAGDPYAADPYQVRLSYALRPCRRHEILARLAREGLCPQLVTTNYDLLIEGAYRLAGLEWRASAPRSSSFSTHTPYFSVVGGPLEFFDLGDGTQSALILKMHGCAHTYRGHKQRALENNLGSNGTDPDLVLPSLCSPRLVCLERGLGNRFATRDR